MQNLQTLKELGFQCNTHGELFFRRHETNRIFVARVIECNGPITYVQLYVVSDKIDERPNSDRKGRHYQTFLKDCCSTGSVERAIKQYEQ